MMDKKIRIVNYLSGYSPKTPRVLINCEWKVDVKERKGGYSSINKENSVTLVNWRIGITKGRKKQDEVDNNDS